MPGTLGVSTLIIWFVRAERDPAGKSQCDHHLVDSQPRLHRALVSRQPRAHPRTDLSANGDPIPPAPTNRIFESLIGSSYNHGACARGTLDAAGACVVSSAPVLQSMRSLGSEPEERMARGGGAKAVLNRPPNSEVDWSV